MMTSSNGNIFSATGPLWGEFTGHRWTLQGRRSGHKTRCTLWRHQMKTFSASMTFCAGNSLVTSEFPSQRPVTLSFDIFFDLRLNKRLNERTWGWWFETPSCSLCRHCIVLTQSPDPDRTGTSDHNSSHKSQRWYHSNLRDHLARSNWTTQFGTPPQRHPVPNCRTEKNETDFTFATLQWRHNGCNGVSNHWHIDFFAQPFVQAQIKENTKAPCHWSFWGESTGDQ